MSNEDITSKEARGLLGIDEASFDEVQVPKRSLPGSKTGGSLTRKEERPVSEFWLNIGIRRPGPDGQPVFLSLPVGVPLTGQKAKSIPNLPANYKELTSEEQQKKVDFRNRRIAELNLFEQVEKLCGTLAPGETKILKLEVELRRISPKDEVSEMEVKTNHYLSDEISLL